MRSLSSALVLVAAFIGSTVPNCRSAGFSLFHNFWGDVIVTTDMTPEGRVLRLPSPAEPVYYLGRSLGNRLGTIPGDRLPDTKESTQLVARILAKQGYIGARPGVHDPSLYLVVQWGYLQPSSGDLLWFLGYDPKQDIASPSVPGMLGPEVFRRNFRSREIETILQNASDPIYGIIVTAFEFKSANTPKPVIYWQTRIGLPAIGKSMAEALPAMLVAGGPMIGHETSKPVLRDADRARDGSVDLGQLKVIGIEDQPVPPDSTAATKKP